MNRTETEIDISRLSHLDTRTYLAAKLTEVGRGDLKNFVLKNGDTGIRKISGIKLPPIGTA